MLDARDILKDAITKRLASYSSDLFLHLLIGGLSIIAGVGIFLFLWVEFRSDDTELIAQLAGGATTLVTFGVGGTLMQKVLSIRSEIREGQEWLELYSSALGPPPDDLLSEVKQRILDWLEG